MTTHIKTPIGWLEATFSGDTLVKINFQDSPPEELSSSVSGREKKLHQQLTEYFEGSRSRFDLSLSPEGTSFQKQVWQRLAKIPYGQTISYGELARRLNDPNKMRAVGRANGQNPLPIIIPCHRVIGSNGTLTGYSGGIKRKKWLLRHEGALLL